MNDSPRFCFADANDGSISHLNLILAVQECRTSFLHQITLLSPVMKHGEILYGGDVDDVDDVDVRFLGASGAQVRLT